MQVLGAERKSRIAVRLSPRLREQFVQGVHDAVTFLAPMLSRIPMNVELGHGRGSQR